MSSIHDSDSDAMFNKDLRVYSPVPPTDWRALCAELLLFAEQAGEIAANESLWPKCDPDCSMLDRTAAALAQPEPKMVYRYSPVTIAECGGPCEQGPQYCDCGEIKGELETQRERQGPTDEEIRDLWSWAAGQDQGPWPTQQHCFARAALARWGRLAIEPVPVSERLPEPEDCDAEDEVWVEEVGSSYAIADTGDYGWEPHKYVLRPLSDWDTKLRHRWLPHWALPVPQQTP